MTDKTTRVATDVGGTFTDLVYFETDRATGRQSVRTEKSDTTPPDFERGVLDVLAKGGVEIAAVDFFAHGTTVVINALTERKGARVGLITTRGFRDAIEIGRGNRPDFFNLMYRKPEPFVERYLRREIGGRMDYRGTETAPLDLSTLDETLALFRAEGVEAMAICLLHAYANPAHEAALKAEVERRWPEATVVASHQITREWREYERTNTTILSAYVQPRAERYLARLEAGLTAQGYRGQLFIMQSNCGVDSVEAIKAVPITMVESGPASGFWGAAELGRIIGEPDVLALDIGGTTAKCSLILDGQVRIKTDYWIERDRKSAGYPIMVRWSIWSRSATAAARSPGSTISPSSMSGRSRPAPARARRPTAAAASAPPPPTPTWRWGGSTPTISAAARWWPTWPPSAPRSTRWPNRSA